METIFIATDFSAAAKNATRFGFELARSMRAKVILFTAYYPPLAMPDSALYVAHEELEKNSYKLLSEEAAIFDPERTVAFEIQSREGTATSSILDAAEENEASYIVLGMKDSGTEIRKYFGNTVTHLCKTSTVPLIVVPANAIFTEPAKIALACDIIDNSEVKVLDPLKKIAGHFDSRLFIVRVIKKSCEEAEEVSGSEGITWYLTNVEHHFEVVHAGDVVQALNGFVEQQSMDMIAVIPHQHNLFEKIFSHSVTKELIFKTHIPILVLPGSKVQAKPAAQPTGEFYSNYVVLGI